MRSFTLVELLVVITIIGILASIVLVNFPGAIKKAKDSRVVSDLAQFRTQAIVLYANKESYDSVRCTVSGNSCNCGDSTIEYLCGDIEENIASDQDLITYVNSDGQGFCAMAKLQGSGLWFCIDGRYHARQYDMKPDTTCNSACETQTAEDNACRCE